MRCEKHDCYLDDGRTVWAHAPCKELGCGYCTDRPETPEDCPLGPCHDCPHLDFGLRISQMRLKTVRDQVNKHKVASQHIEARMGKSLVNRHKTRLVIICKHSLEIIAEFDTGLKGDHKKKCAVKRPIPTQRAFCWWYDYLDDLPPAEEVAPPSHRDREQAALQQRSGKWKGLKKKERTSRSWLHLPD